MTDALLTSYPVLLSEDDGFAMGEFCLPRPLKGGNFFIYLKTNPKMELLTQLQTLKAIFCK